MLINIDEWIKGYINKLQSLFGPRLWFVGLQGSYGRNEATDSSDLDVVVILDQVAPEDLKAYSAMLDGLSDREKVCGFISGQQELTDWERSDLFQFCYDTTPLFGSIDFLRPLISEEDVRRAVRIGACNIYHLCGHNMVHKKDSKILLSLYKSASFTVQAICFLQTGNYLKQKAELVSALQPPEQKIIQTGIALKRQPDLAQTKFDQFSKLLFEWAGRLIKEYKNESE